MNDVITARQRAVNRHVTHGRWRLPWSLDLPMYCRSLRTFDAQRCTVGSQLPQVIPGKLRTSRNLGHDMIFVRRSPKNCVPQGT